MGYFEDQVAAARKRIGDAIAGKALRENIRQLQDKAKVRSSLKDAPVRGDLTSRKKIGKRVNASSSSSGDMGEFIEERRTFYTTLRELRSSDSLFVLEYYNVKNIFMDRATFTYLDYDPDA